MTTVNELLQNENFKALSLPDGERQITGAYAGDLLSWVMGRAKPGQCFVTIMTNINVLAVASLLDLPCVIICEDACLADDFVKAAKDKDINLLRTALPTYETCVLLGKML